MSARGGQNEGRCKREESRSKEKRLGEINKNHLSLKNKACISQQSEACAVDERVIGKLAAGPSSDDAKEGRKRRRSGGKR